MPAKRRLAWAPSAEKDVNEIWRYLAGEASIKTADDVLRRISGLLSALPSTP